MPVTLDASVGGVASNTYLTLAEAETYFESKLHKTAWTNATEANKNIALVESTRLLDGQCRYEGRKWDDDQALEWPRSAVYDRNEHWITHESIPVQVKNATAELAMWLLSKDRASERAEPSNSGIESVGVGSGAVNVKFDTKDRLELIPSDIINNLLQGLGRVPSEMGDIVPVSRS